MRWTGNERLEAEELLDDAAIPLADARATLRDQAMVNRWLGGGRATLAHAIPWLRRCPSRPVRVLEGACGGADLSRGLVDAARRYHIPVAVTAFDVNRQVLACARAFSAGYPEIAFVRGDIVHPPFPSGAFDLVLLPTVLHHLPSAQVIPLLQAAREVCRGQVIVSDVVRSRLAYLGIAAVAGLARFSPVTRHDGPVSVRRAYTPQEMTALACAAGLAGWVLHRHAGYRMTLVFAGGYQQVGSSANRPGGPENPPCE